jgi:elongation factor P
MLSHTDLKKGIMFIMEGQPFEVLDFSLNFQGRGSSTVQIKAKNLITGAVLSKTFHTGEEFEEAEIAKKDLRFLYSHQDQFFFCETEGPSKRFFLNNEQVGLGAKFLKANQIVKGLVFKDKFINIELPIKVQLKVIEAPPGVKAGRAESGTKQIVLETGAKVQSPLFVEEGDIIEVNTETEEYVKRINE